MSQQNRPRQPQQVLTTVWAAGPQDIAISSHDDRWNSWVAVRVGQVATYAVGLEAPTSIARIWTEAADRAAALLPLTFPTQPKVDGPSVVVRLTGEQAIDRRGFPYDGRSGAAHILIGGILWRPVDSAALTGIADAWRRAAQIAHTLTGGLPTPPGGSLTSSRPGLARSTRCRAIHIPDPTLASPAWSLHHRPQHH